MNLYVTLNNLKNDLGIPSATTTYDTDLMRFAGEASRIIDGHCHRHFYAKSETRYFDSFSKTTILVDDILSLTSLAIDTEADGTYDGESWTPNTDFYLNPPNLFPKTQVMQTAFGSYSFADMERGMKIVALFGYGDGESATPWESTAITVTADNSTETELDVLAEGTIEAGHTIRVESEDIYVSAATTGGTKKITVQRGVNGSTAAAHNLKAASIHRYPAPVVRATSMVACNLFLTRSNYDAQMESVGGYTRMIMMPDKQNMALTRVLGPYIRYDFAKSWED